MEEKEPLLIECPRCKKITLRCTDADGGIEYKCMNPKCHYKDFKSEESHGFFWFIVVIGFFVVAKMIMV